MNGYQRALGIILLLFAFVYLMLCPYAELLSVPHGGKVLINQNDIRKTKKLHKKESYAEPRAILLDNHAPLLASSPSPLPRTADTVMFSQLNLSIVSTVHLLL